MNFPVQTIETAPERSKPVLEGVKKSLGFIPNLFGVFASSPAVLKTYLSVEEHFSQSSLSPTEQHIVYLTVSRENKCMYCMSAHSAIAKGAKVPADTVAALREGRPLADAKLETFRKFVAAVVQKRGWVAQDEVKGMIDAGYTPAQVLEVLIGVSLKTLSNYTNHIAHTPLDKVFKSEEWIPPA